MDELREAAGRMADVLGIDSGDDADQYKRKLEAKTERIKDLEATVSKLESQGYSLDDEFEETIDFVKHEAVREEIQRAAEKTRTRNEHTWESSRC